MNIIELPVNGEIMRINWEREKFVSIIPKNNESSVLVYNGMQIEIGISATTFNQMMDKEVENDNLNEQITNMMQNYKFSGEFWFNFNRNEKYANLVQVKWKSDVNNVTNSGKSKSKIMCLTEINISFLVNNSHTQTTRSVTYLKKHDMKKNETEITMRNFIIDSLYSDVINVVDPNRKLLKEYWRNDNFYGNFKNINYFYDTMENEIVPLYINVDYDKCLISDAALTVELSRFGNVEVNSIAYSVGNAMAEAKIKAARIIALGPLICQKLREEGMYKELAGKATEFGYKYNASRYEDKAISAKKVAMSMLY
jgi:hypothetical protein